MGENVPSKIADHAEMCSLLNLLRQHHISLHRLVPLTSDTCKGVPNGVGIQRGLYLM